MSTSCLALGSMLVQDEPWYMPGSPIEWIYIGAAALGGAVMVLQVLLSLFGVGADTDHDFGHDVGHDAGHEGDAGSAAGGWLSFRAIVAFLTFFGLGGMVASTRGSGGITSMLVALGTGSIALVLTRLALLQFDKLRSSGTVDVRNAIGAEGRVYLTIPAAKSGQGAVTVGIQGRTMQYRAITPGPELKTGALCKVSAVHASDTLVVDAL